MGKRPGGSWLEPLRPGAKRLKHALSWVLPRVSQGELLTVPSEGVHNGGRDNAEHDYVCRVGDRIGTPGGGESFEVLGLVGRGTFGQVLRCRTLEGGQLAAVKVIKHAAFCAGMAAAAEEEVSILQRINNATGSTGGEYIVQMLDSFLCHGHVCIAFELLGPDLLTVLQREGRPGMPLAFIRTAARQLLAALQRLRSVSVIHGDLKPENVLLVPDRAPLGSLAQREPHVKLIDFGSAQVGGRVAETEDIIIQTLPYRAPEVLLGLSYTCAVDMWSFGCMCAELVLGRPLFPHGGSEHDIVCNTLELLGPIPQHMLQAGRNTTRYFQRTRKAGVVSNGSAKRRSWSELLKSCCRRRWACPSMAQLLGTLFRMVRRPDECPAPLGHDYHLKCIRQKQDEIGGSRITSLEHAISLLRFEISYTRTRLPRRLRPEVLQTQRVGRLQLLRFLMRCLRTNPDERWAPYQASCHAFVRGALPGCREASPWAWSLGGSPFKKSR